ncbi:hypothetical protein BDN67DRAFT_1044543 [Paxillus ammoniavirescens]|nr:hypothetical protein BDN67DRAFT_1044543 [Paxillus ammoniavirescens]
MAIMQFTFSIDQPAPTGPNVGVTKPELKPSAEFEETATRQAISSNSYYGQQQPLSVTGTMALWQATATDSDGHSQQQPFSAMAILSDGHYQRWPLSAMGTMALRQAMATMASDGHSQRRPFSAMGTMAPWPAMAGYLARSAHRPLAISHGP